MAERFDEIESEADREYYALWHGRTHRWGRFFGYQAEGNEHVPAEGRGMVVFNHIGGLDTFFGVAAIKDRAAVAIGRRKYTEMFVIGSMFRRFGVKTIDRPRDTSDPRLAAIEAIRIMKEPLEQDHLEVVYGMRDTRIPGFKPGFPVSGIAKVAYETQAPVNPAAIKGTDHKIGNLLFKGFRTKIGPSIPPPENRKERSDWSHHLWELETELFDSIPSRFNYKPVDPETGLPTGEAERGQLLKILLHLNSQKQP